MSKPRSAPRRSSAEWALLVEACERSGLSRAAFAERECIHPGTFSFWASRLAAKQGKTGKATVRAAASSFVPVRVQAREAAPERGTAVRVGMSRSLVAVVPSASAADSIEIALANVRRVRCALSQVGGPRLAAQPATRVDMHRLQELVRLHRMGTGCRAAAALLCMSSEHRARVSAGADRVEPVGRPGGHTAAAR